MTLSQLANLGEFIGGFAVIVSLVYVAIQIRNNTKAVGANTQQGLFSSWSELSSDVIQNADVANLLLAGKDPSITLSPEDEVRFDWLSTRLFGQWENAYSQFLEGLLDPKHWKVYEASYRDMTHGHRYRKFWASHRHWYFEEFAQYIDDLQSKSPIEA